MAARKTEEKAAESVAQKLLDAFDDLARMRCPACGCATLTADAIMRSGVRISCEGYNRHADDHQCEFVAWALSTRTDELPKEAEKQ